MKGPVKFLAGLTLLCAFVISGCLNNTEELIIEGTYCTVRDGITGLVSSDIYITPDTLDDYDFIISNISGYPTPSDAYRDVPAYLAGTNVLRIPEYEHIISNDSNLKIWGRGEIVDGLIFFEIHTIRDEETIYELSAVSGDNTLSNSEFRKDGQELIFNENGIKIQVTDNENIEHVFTLPIEMSACSIKDLEMEIMNENNSEAEDLMLSLFYFGNRIDGTMSFSKDNWSTETKVDFSLPKVN